MDFFADNILLIIFLPVWISLIILSGLMFKLTGNNKITVLITVLSSLTGLIFSLMLFNGFVKDGGVTENTFLWLGAGGINIMLGTRIDMISLVFLAVLMLISLLVQLYSYGYMKDKKGFGRYYIYLNLFNFAMAGLISAPDLIQLYIFWELVGVISYLLIGFFHEEEDVSKAAKRVFIINRAGDCALLCGIIIFAYFSVCYINQAPNEFLAFNDLENFYGQMQVLVYPDVYNLICSLFLIGAFVKSAQFPFQGWLIDAMKAPTPVSALIHSATMVCAGIFLIIRIYPLLNEELLNFILITGLITAVLCSFIAISQTDIKKMLAYSTSSQLGLIFTALGLHSIRCAVIYLVIHSFTKALLFLCTGNISKICASIDMGKISGVRKIDFFLAMYWFIAALSLSGIFFGGFTSKEMLINAAKDTGNISIIFLILLTSFMSSYYIFRAYFNIFEGKKAVYSIFKDSSFALPVLSAFVIVPGFMFKLSNVDILCIASVLTGAAGVFAAYFGFKFNKAPLIAPLYKLSGKELFIPQIYDFTGNIFTAVYKLVNLFEQYVIEGMINIIVKLNRLISNIISKLQNGNIQTYVSYSLFSIGIILMIVFYFYAVAARG